MNSAISRLAAAAAAIAVTFAGLKGIQVLARTDLAPDVVVLPLVEVTARPAPEAVGARAPAPGTDPVAIVCRSATEEMCVHADARALARSGPGEELASQVVR